MTTYVGPYVRVPAVTRDEVVSTRVCSAHCSSAPLSERTRFCPDCGAAVQSSVTSSPVTRVVSASVAAEAVGREYVDLMASARESSQRGYSAWIPNRHGFGQYLKDDEPVDLPDAGGQGREAEIAKFLLHHGQFLAAVEAHYGVAPTVHFGVVVIRY